MIVKLETLFIFHHKLRYAKLATAVGLLTNSSVIATDWRFVPSELKLANDPRISVVDRLKATGLGIGLGFYAWPKTLLDMTIKTFTFDFAKKSNNR
jgi:hypothetical protein